MRRNQWEAGFWIITSVVAILIGSMIVQAKTPDGKWLIGFAQDTLNQPWRAYQAKVVERELKKLPNVVPLITDGQGRSEKQIANIEDMVTRGIDLLIVSPNQEGALTPVISQVFKKGIPVICIDRGVTGEDYTLWVKGNNFKIAAMCADYIAQKLTKKYGEPMGNVVVLEGVPGSSSAIERGQGFRSRLAEKYPKMKILASQPADYRRDKAMHIMEDYLQTFPKIDALFSMADEMTMGAVFAIENAGRRKEMVIASMNATSEAIKALMDGRLDCTPLYPNCVAPAVEAAMKLLAGQKLKQKVVLIDPVMIDETNASKFYFPDRYTPE